MRPVDIPFSLKKYTQPQKCHPRHPLLKLHPPSPHSIMQHLTYRSYHCIRFTQRLHRPPLPAQFLSKHLSAALSVIITFHLPNSTLVGSSHGVFPTYAFSSLQIANSGGSNYHLSFGYGLPGSGNLPIDPPSSHLSSLQTLRKRSSSIPRISKGCKCDLRGRWGPG